LTVRSVQAPENCPEMRATIARSLCLTKCTLLLVHARSGACLAIPQGGPDVPLKGAKTMDARALAETLVAVAMTPVISVAMALAVIGGIVLLARKVYRG
jgi:hypothetical protein